MFMRKGGRDVEKEGRLKDLKKTEINVINISSAHKYSRSDSLQR